MRTSTRKLPRWLRRSSLPAIAILLGLGAALAFFRTSGEQRQANHYAQSSVMPQSWENRNAGVPPAADKMSALPPSEILQSTRISADEAIAVALNNLTPMANGFQLEHPRHLVQFTETGVQFTPRRGGPEWRWQLQRVGSASIVLQNLEPASLQPVHESQAVIRYSRGEIEEQYLLRKSSIEQQFVIPRPLELAGEDLVITGKVESAGEFEKTKNGWQWRTEQGGVTLGEVAVFDANGAALPATMQVTATETRIEVDGASLAAADYPVTIDPEIGANDFRLSDMGPDAKVIFNTHDPAVAYNSTNNEYLVVWEAFPVGIGNDKVDIHGQRLDAATGAQLGTDDFRISDMGNGDQILEAFDPAVAYNSADNEYLVVWEGDDTVNEEFEIYGQRLDAATGSEIGTDDFRLSDMGPDGDFTFDAVDPAVAYNSANNEYLVVWEGDDDDAPLVDEEFEIFGQRLDAAGAEVGTNDSRLSDMGPNGNTSFSAREPAVAYNSANNEYLVVWEGDDDTAPLVEEEFEIFGQRLDAAGAEVGTNDSRLSDMGPNGNTSFSAHEPAVAYNSANNEYLVVWEGDDNTSPLVDEEFEIFGQRLDAAGAEVGTNDFRLSDMGPNGNTSFSAHDPVVAYNSANNEYLVVWEGDDNTSPLVDEEFEIFGQRLDAAGAEVGSNDFRLSDMGPNGNTSFSANDPAVAYNSANNEYSPVWDGNDTTPFTQHEIFAQRVVAATGAETGDNDFHVSDIGPNHTSFAAFDPAMAYNSANNEYLVVWEGDDNTSPLGDGDFEIFGQRIDAASGAEVGTNDFRISDMGPDGDDDFRALDPAVAYNSANNEYLVVWQSDDDTAPLVDQELEIFGQRLDAATGAEVGTNDFCISDMGPDGNTNFHATFVSLAYNSANNEYLVVWHGDDDTAPLVDNEFEIFGQRIDAATGAEVGSNDFRISDMGPDGNTNFQASSVSLAYNSANNEYLVVWRGDDDTAPLVDNEEEIFGQRINAATGAEVGTNDFRLSDMGPDGDTNFFVITSAVAYNRSNNEYLVVWQGSDDSGLLVAFEFEIFGQRIDAATGAEVGSNDFRISDMGPDGMSNFSASDPAVTYNNLTNQYLVVWEGDDDTAPLANDEFEIFGQQIDATGAEVGDNDFRLSDMGPDGNVGFAANEPAVAYNSTANEYLVAWWGDDNTAPLTNDENEIFGQRYQGDIVAPNANAGLDQNVCSGKSVQIGGSPTGSGGNGGPYTFSWSPATGLDDPSAANPNASPGATTTYTVTVTEIATGLSNMDAMIVTVIPSPIANAGLDATIFSSQSVQIGGSPTASGGTPPYSYSWVPNNGSLDDVTASNPNASPASTTTYTVTVMDASGCTATDEVIVEVIIVKPFVFLANKVTLGLTKQNTPAGDIHSNGTLTVNKGDPSTYKSNLTAIGKITINAQNTIDGNVKSQTAISNFGTITGTKTIGAVNNEPLPSLIYSAGGLNKTVPQNGTLALAPGSYNNVILNSFSTLKLTSGDYYFTSLKFNSSTTTSAVIEINLSSGDPITLNVVSNLFLGTEVEIRLLPNGEDDSKLVTFNTKQSTAMNLGREAYLLGSFNAPNAKVTLLKNSQLRGSICAKEIVTDRDCLFLHHDSPGSLPGPGNLPKSSADDDEQPVTSYELQQNYPNPFNPTTTISFALPEAGEVSLAIYNLNGQLVKKLVAGEMNAGRHNVLWDATNARGERVASGVYLYIIKAANFTARRKLVLMK